MSAADERRPQARMRVAVVFGGRSSEHSVSCLTAGQVMAALDPSRYDVVPIGISREGRWVLDSMDPQRFVLGPSGLPDVDGKRDEVALTPDPGRRELTVTEPGDVPRSLGHVDVVFPVLHGPWGEDGTIQGLLELAGIRYVGAGVAASAVGMDKALMKAVFGSAGLPVLPHVVVPPGEWQRDPAAVRESVASLGLPCFVKPARAGSSFGISKVEQAQDLDRAIDVAAEHDPKVLVEAAARSARELECGVLQGVDGGPPTASVVGEARVEADSGHAFYDFEAKYLDGAAQIDVPAHVPGDVSERVRSMAVAAFEAIGCEGLARVDFFGYDDGRVMINEINTMPGFTPTSMFPLLWRASGLSYGELIERLVHMAWARPLGLR